MVCFGFTTPRFYVLCPFQWMPKISNPYFMIRWYPCRILSIFNALNCQIILGLLEGFPRNRTTAFWWFLGGGSCCYVGNIIRYSENYEQKHLWFGEMRRSIRGGTGDDSLDPEVPKTGGSSHVDPSRILMLEVLAATPSMENQIQKTCTVNWLAIHDLIGGCNSCSWMLLTAVFLLLLRNEGGMTNIHDKFAFDPQGPMNLYLTM